MRPSKRTRKPTQSSQEADPGSSRASSPVPVAGPSSTPTLTGQKKRGRPKKSDQPSTLSVRPDKLPGSILLLLTWFYD